MQIARKTSLGYEKVNGKATVYVCSDQTCLPPSNNIDKMLELVGCNK